MKVRVRSWALVLIALWGLNLLQAENQFETLEFAKVSDQSLKLDLYKPKSDQLHPLIVWVHGGAWRAGSRASVPIKDFLDRGWAIASVDYRLSGQAKFPAQIHDIKAAIRFLRAKGTELGIDSDNVTIAGASAGGHLAVLVGVTNSHSKLEGKIGGYDEFSSEVQGIVSFFGASNLETILQQSTPHGLKVRKPALDLFIGGQPENVSEIANLASPVNHVDEDDPPLFWVHGVQDPQMPVNQAVEMFGEYEAFGLPVELEFIYSGKHGGEEFYASEILDQIELFLRNSS